MNIKRMLEIGKEAGIKFEPRFGQSWTGNIQMNNFADLIIEEAAKLCDARYELFLEPEILEMAAEIRAMKTTHSAVAYF